MISILQASGGEEASERERGFESSLCLDMLSCFEKDLDVAYYLQTIAWTFTTPPAADHDVCAI